MKLGTKYLLLEFFDKDKRVIHEKDLNALGDSIENYFKNLKVQQDKLNRIKKICEEK